MAEIISLEQYRAARRTPAVVIPIRKGPTSCGYDAYAGDYWRNRDISFEEKKRALEQSIFGPQKPCDTE